MAIFARVSAGWPACCPVLVKTHLPTQHQQHTGSLQGHRPCFERVIRLTVDDIGDHRLVNDPLELSARCGQRGSAWYLKLCRPWPSRLQADSMAKSSAQNCCQSLSWYSSSFQVLEMHAALAASFGSRKLHIRVVIGEVQKSHQHGIQMPAAIPDSTPEDLLQVVADEQRDWGSV